MNKTLLSQIILILIVFSGLSLQAQHEKCAFDQILEQKQQDESFLRRQADFERYVREFAENRAQARNTGTVTIPCVVHIVHTGQAVGTQDVDNSNDGTDGANPNDAQINSAISNMNDAFKHTGPYASLNGYTAALDVNFVLAKTAPDGSATTGINRYDVSGESWGAQFANEGMDAGMTPGVPHATITAGRYWPPMDYMNIWIVHEIENATTTLGFAAFPNSNDGSTDNMVMLASAFGYDPENDDGYLLDSGTNLNGTANHETGHYLNLYHTFQGDGGGANCPGNTTCGTDSDCCDDIPPHKRSSGCPADNSTGNDCTGGPNSYIHNFMDYADDACFHGFSEDQKTRMNAALSGPRVALCNSIGDDSPAANYPATVTSPAVTNADQTMGIYDVTLNGTTFKSWSSHHDGGYANRVASAPRVNLLFNTMYSMTVQVGVGNTSNDELVNVYIDYDNDGSFSQAGDEVYVTAAGSGKKNGESFTFNFTTPSSSTPPGGSAPPPSNQGLRMRIISDFDNGVNPLTHSTVPSNGGQIEDYTIQLSMALPVELISFQAKPDRDAIQLTWQTAVERNNSRFEIQRSTSETTAFQTIGVIAGHGTTEEKQQYVFRDQDVKSNVQYYYRLKQIDFDERYEFSEIVTAILNTREQTQLKVFPNPTNNHINVSLEGRTEGITTLQLFNATGQMIASKTINTNQSSPVEFDLRELPGGVYIIQAIGKFEPQSEKVILNKS